MLMKPAFLFFLLAATALSGQTKVGERWVDNNLTILVTEEAVRQRGEFYICIADTSRGPCIENLVTGVSVGVYTAADELLWEGIATGRTRGMKLPRPMPEADYLLIEAFKPWVVNKTTGNYIHQDQAIRVKYRLK